MNICDVNFLSRQINYMKLDKIVMKTLSDLGVCPLNMIELSKSRKYVTR